MSSKPHATGGDTRATSPWPAGGVLELHGRDAGVFAQAQLMNDVRLLADGHWQWNGWLSAKGRVIALGALLRIDAERYWWLLPDHEPQPLADALQRFVFRSKVGLAVRDDLHPHAASAPPATLGFDAQGARAGLRDGSWCLDWSGRTPRSLLLAGANEHAPSGAAMDADAWALQDLAHGLPRLPAKAREAYTPQMLGLARLSAYSVKKGCYPGQEIVARTHFLGQAKRGLCRLRSDVALTPGTPVLRDGNALGDVVCSATDGIRHEALALLPLADVAAGLNAGTAGVAAAVEPIEFEHGLAR